MCIFFQIKESRVFVWFVRQAGIKLDNLTKSIRLNFVNKPMEVAIAIILDKIKASMFLFYG